MASDIYDIIKKSGWIITILIISSAIAFFVKSCNIIQDYTSNNKPLRTYPNFQDIDELKKKKSYSDKEMIEIMWENQKVLNSRYDNILADIRQESNNTIEKVTAELNFWVAVLAFLGVLVPIAITFKGDKDLKDRFESKMNVHESRLNIFLKSAGHEIQGWKDKYFEILSRGEEIDVMKEELELEMNSICLTSIRNNRLLESQSDLLRAQRILSHETIRKFLTFFEKEIFNNDNYRSPDKKWKLIKYSMQFYDMLRTLSIDFHGSTRPRYIIQAEDAAKKMIIVLMDEFPDEGTIKNQFAELLKRTKRILNESYAL